MPALFLAHGAPPLLDDEVWVSELARWATSLPRPRSILMISAHWEARPATLGATSPVPLIYDFYGFPERYYQLTYPAPGAPELAERVRELLRAGGIPWTDDPRRGLDHGAYVPLACMVPAADVPVLQLSLPSMDTRELFAMGRALAPLRDEGVLIIGSGFLTHNLRARGSSTPGWAHDIDAWCADVLARWDIDALLDYVHKAPGVAQALPTHEHFVPLVVAAGAASDERAAVTFPITGFWERMGFASLTRRSVQLG